MDQPVTWVDLMSVYVGWHLAILALAPVMAGVVLLVWKYQDGQRAKWRQLADETKGGE